jgi:hypothetical protein
MTDEEELAIEALAALPGGTGDDIADDGFSALILRKIHQRRRRKALILGAAGSGGSAIAGAQLTAMVGAMPAVAATNENVAPFLTAMTPEAIAATGLAGLVALIAFIVPGRI